MVNLGQGKEMEEKSSLSERARYRTLSLYLLGKRIFCTKIKEERTGDHLNRSFLFCVIIHCVSYCT